MNSSIKVEKHFKRFADFLIKERTDVLAEMLHEHILLLKVPKHKQLLISEKEVIASHKRRWIDFLITIKEGYGLEDVRRRISDWRQLRGLFTSSEIKAEDVVFIYQSQKVCLLKSLDQYTEDFSIFKSLLWEIEEFFSEVTKIIVSAFCEYQKEIGSVRTNIQKEHSSKG